MNSIQTSHVLLIENERVLLVKHEDGAGHLTGSYGIPGGRKDDVESFKQAAIRELTEETGFFVDDKDLKEYDGNEYTADIKRKSGETKRYTMKVFYAVKFAGEIKSSEETTPEWVKINELNQYKLLTNVEKAVKDAVNKL
ncbi:hypothetical protein A3G67_01160 [Candidatus Roizmanbacteria bacterium RIFCSPLOWO2_12_FULL_40_12]|uniref:Nudix hydrolase domain-containing protein n=1 Tax=Candidatus Roizmanbacteria bacterium RIFCSPLOWO2_01_FULL_40_42 TaxID=1802066 RepID=A0A1F7J248_9BACT|nr:MAG: hypothetical protein A2779_00880 [Candidatus Roizmanbacteria bacterium RIFCSPHIGHO2_01_FULL_40_98]OGK27601.1 MAG: hypothetical protein A3C31_02405 [Candidatus Roizmanbacteria bacterium RIFCSPHIGHO2_02_FULL_40_53]OGK30383.1 MAG: hypothetical protein A2W49_00690 [Candidatus Roizmanbacteria bacterium RIFCSPHIGHO2_12_41_18]OGK36155.1 MAG: hypothetical protein A3E69_01200 [Candidatus Roizmanbacteria bacterium RIFCSPHIGHO2_12_FULL_40_130]OGK49681.1 MAG: hypothetical protein A3B50_03055 [Candi